MTSLWQSGLPGDPAGDASHEYAMWDAAYVLGSLSSADRREYEAHLADCPSCRGGVAELSGMPALLSRLDRDQVAAIDEGRDVVAAPGPPPQVLASLLAKVSWRRRRRSRLTTWTATAAAAAVLAVGVFIGIATQSPTAVRTGPTPPQASDSGPSQMDGSALPMAQVGTAVLASTVSVSSESWGTFIWLNCVCLAPLNHPADRLAMVVVGRDGSRTQLATWVAHPGHTATPAGSISTSTGQIASVQVVSADTGDVLLQRLL